MSERVELPWLITSNAMTAEMNAADEYREQRLKRAIEIATAEGSLNEKGDHRLITSKHMLQAIAEAAETARLTAERDAALAEVERLTRRNAELTDSEERMAGVTRIAESHRRMVCKLAADREAERDTLQARVAELERELAQTRIVGGTLIEQLGATEIAFGAAETARTAAEQQVTALRQALTGAETAWKEADDERLEEHRKAQDEAEKWKREGDMYGWNFHQGMASGMTSASIIFARVQRFIDAALAGDDGK